MFYVQAHPRSRGEHSTQLPAIWLWVGSSPLARGTLVNSSGAGSGGRLIPARAGNTENQSACGSIHAAHPRSRGEHSSIPRMMTRAPGSSPLARGTLPLPGQEVLELRLIPARAGNTLGAGSIPCAGSAHPRSRGEHGGGVGFELLLRGSSPLARGTRLERRGGCAGLRLIPARAGNTRYWLDYRRSCPAHPRSRGEHHDYPSYTASATGSSPLARGTPPCWQPVWQAGRLIPARAGNTLKRVSTNMSMKAHPRSRGEHIRLSTGITSSSGSSPLARGTQSSFTCHVFALRLIPARAGNTRKK